MKNNTTNKIACIAILWTAFACGDTIVLESTGLDSPSSYGDTQFDDIPNLFDLIPINEWRVIEKPHGPSDLFRLGGGLAHLLDVNGQPQDADEVEAVCKKYRIECDSQRIRVLMVLAEGISAPSDNTIGNIPIELERSRERQMEAWVALDDLAELAMHDYLHAIVPVRHVQTQQTQNVVTEGLEIIGALEFHDAGYKGHGIMVGILDAGFAGYDALLGTELPDEVVTKSFYRVGIDEHGNAVTDITGGGTVHGTAVAEIIHDLAPEADLVLVNARTTLEYLDAIDWLTNEQGVHLISTSVGFISNEPLDGRGIIAQSASAVRDAGSMFISAAGNYAIQHYMSVFEPDSIGFHRFGEINWLQILNIHGNCYLPVNTEIRATLVWDDWGSDPSVPTSTADYDLYLVRFFNNQASIVDSSEHHQNGSAYPVELINYRVKSGAAGCYGLAVREFDASHHHNFQLFVDGNQNMRFKPTLGIAESSLITPCVGNRVTCVGATDLSDDITFYSSRGPTIPNEITGVQMIKPNFVAPSGVSTLSYGFGLFHGTSASAPHVAGAAALLLQMSGNDLEEVENYLEQYALDLGEEGKDNLYGHGRVELPSCTCFHETECCNGCLSINEGNNCTLACIVGSVCHQGLCDGGEMIECVPLSECHEIGECDTETGLCTNPYKPDGTSCAGDNDSCNLSECMEGLCVNTPIPNDCGNRQCGMSPSGCFNCGACDSGFECNADGECIGLCDDVVCPECQSCFEGICYPANEEMPCTDDGNECTQNFCLAGICEPVPVDNDTPCTDDGNECTENICLAGTCEPVPVINDTPCTSDGNPCTLNLCLNGVCEHPTISNDCGNRQCGMSPSGCFDCGTCDSGFECNADGECIGLCDDVVCPECQSCFEGICYPANEEMPCTDDGNECTENICLAGTCEPVPVNNNTPCTSDGNPCTLNLCLNGVCEHPTISNDCGNRQCGMSPSGCHYCGNCDSGFFCNANGACIELCNGVECPECQSCFEGICYPDNEEIPCTDDGNECTENICLAGICEPIPVDNDTPCTSDGNECTENICLAGTCEPVPMDDDTPCTDDGNECTENICLAGTCEPVPMDDDTPCTSDGNPCTLNLCLNGVCEHPAITNDCGNRQCGMSPSGCFNCGTCDSGFSCNTDGMCIGLCDDVVCPECQSCFEGNCIPAKEEMPCTDDGNECTENICLAGTCEPVPMDDDTPCTDDGNECTENICLAGTCEPVPVNNNTPCTSDGNPCTLNLCLNGVCEHPTISNDCGNRQCGMSPSACFNCGTCDSGFSCNPDGVCIGLCDDVVCPECQSCFEGICYPANEEMPCTDDGNECTENICLAGTCEPVPVDNDTPCTSDGNECTENICLAGTCEPVPVNNNTPCTSDGNPCTLNLCLNGVCKHPAIPNDCGNRQCGMSPSGCYPCGGGLSQRPCNSPCASGIQTCNNGYWSNCNAPNPSDKTYTLFSGAATGGSCCNAKSQSCNAGFCLGKPDAPILDRIFSVEAGTTQYVCVTARTIVDGHIGCVNCDQPANNHIQRICNNPEPQVNERARFAIRNRNTGQRHVLGLSRDCNNDGQNCEICGPYTWCIWLGAGSYQVEAEHMGSGEGAGSLAIMESTLSVRCRPKRLPNSVIASSEFSNQYRASRVVDGIIGIWSSGEWASAGEMTPWIELQWNSPISVSQIILYDRPNPIDQILSARIILSDGHQINTGTLPLNGSGKTFNFPRRNITSMRIQVLSGKGLNVGLSEIEFW